MEGLEDADPNVRRWMARDLALCPNAASALVDRLRRETEVSVREVILTALACIGDPTAISALAEYLRSDDAALRNEVIETLKQRSGEVDHILQKLLSDPDPDVRIFAVNILESLRNPDVEAWLIEVIETDPQVNVCATAVDLLAELGTAAAALALGKLKARFPDEPYIQFCCDLALKRIDES
jgi:HEAT repeat protein